MISRPVLAVGLSFALGLASPAHAAPPATGTPAAAPSATPARADLLPDTTALIRVEDRAFRVTEVVRTYFESYPEYRPAQDSLGRAEFLNTIVNKEVLGRVAKGAGYTLRFEDRQTMREHTQRVLSNVLYQRTVADSISVTPEEIDRITGQFAYDLHLREIVFDSPEAAEEFRANLVAKRITWEAAARENILPKDAKGPDGDIGWISRASFDALHGLRVFDLGPGQISSVIKDSEGFRIFQVVARRPARPVSVAAYRNLIRDQLYSDKAMAGAEALKSMVGRDLDMVYDTTNVRWVASQFKPTRETSTEAGMPNIVIELGVPEFQPTDTSRVLLRYRGGQVTLSRFLSYYMSLPPITRPSVHTPSLLKTQIEGIVLEPFMAEAALQRGLDKDSLAVALIEARREQLLVERMYSDSIESKVFIPVKARRKYFDEHRSQYVTLPAIRYAALYAPNKPAADSLVSRLKAGEKAEAIIQADSLTGFDRGSIRDRRKGEDSAYEKILFEEMKPGEIRPVGPDGEGGYAVLQLLYYDPGRDMTFEDADRFVSESLTNIESEKRLKEFLARHKARFRIETRPDLVMRVRWVNPTI
jgi:hypothetical protein